MQFIIIKTEDTNYSLYQEILELVSKNCGKTEIISTSEKATLSFSGLKIECNPQQVFLNGKDLKLTRHEYDLLFLLAGQAGQVLSKKTILEAVWGKDTPNTMKVVANTISNLRKKIEPDTQHPRYILTVLGGYIFNA